MVQWIAGMFEAGESKRIMEQAQQQHIERTDQQPAIPPLPPWPTSTPGPKVTQPPAGTRRMHVRTEQVIEMNYDDEQGKSSAREERS
jgi:hypothetical protein